MDDLISREAAIEAMRECWRRVNRFAKPLEANRIMDCIKAVKELPAVDAAPVVHGRWEKMTGMMPPEYHGHYCCSECGWHMKGLRNSWTREEELPYCPQCGARMGDKDDG